MSFAPSLSRGLICAALASVVTCTPMLPLVERPCPCAGRWTCCDGPSVCVPEGEACAPVTQTREERTDAGGDAGTCSQECTLGARQCDAWLGARGCVADSAGCLSWGAFEACGGGESCSFNGRSEAPCGCISGDCIAISSLSPGPYVQGQELQIHGVNLGVSSGYGRVHFGSIHSNPRPGSMDSRVLVTIPSLDIPGGSSKTLVLTVSNNTSLAQRLIEVSSPIPSLQGAIDVSWMGATTAGVSREQTTLFRYRVRSRLNKPATIQLEAALRPCGACENGAGWDRPVLIASDGGLLPDYALQLPAGEEKEILVRLTPTSPKEGGTYSLGVEAAAGGIVARTGIVPFTVGGTLPQPSGLFDLDVSDTDPDEVIRSGAVHLSVGGSAVIELLGRVPAGTFDLQLTTGPGTVNWGVASASSTFKAGADGTWGFPWLVTVWAKEGASMRGDFEIRVIHRDSGEARSLYFGLVHDP